MFEGLLNGKSVVITGAGSGVGRAASELFASHGARLVCADISVGPLEATVASVKASGGEAIAVRCDVTKKADIVAAVDAAVKAYGRLDIIFNNVGIPSPKSAGSTGPVRLDENTEEDIDRLIAVNVKGIIFGCQAAIARFRVQGGGGVIVNTASAAGLIGWGGVLYGTTKGAITNLTRSLAMEVAKDGIRVNAVCPAGMPTPFLAGEAGTFPEAALAMLGKSHPLGRVIQPIEAATTALFLASDMSSNTTGVNLPVDGGISAGIPQR